MTAPDTTAIRVGNERLSALDDVLRRGAGLDVRPRHLAERNPADIETDH
jgi:hypothetical protein